ALSETGEDTFVRSPGGFAANVEAVRTPVPEDVSFDDLPAAHVEDTPDTPTIASLVAVANERHPREDRLWTGADTLKNVVLLVTQPDGKSAPLVVGLPGDREVDLKRVQAQLEPAEVEVFDAFADYPMLVKGYIGPEALGEESGSGIRYVVDPRVGVGTRWITGANVNGQHVFDLVCGRDFTPDGFLEAAELREGDPAPDGSGPLELARGIEMGHIFQLDTKFSEALGLRVLDQNGKLVTVTMGSYGLGVSRAVAAVADNTCDDKGLAWPRELAPYLVHVVVAGKDAAALAWAARLADQLDEAGVSVLLDDRKASPGVKFADAEILGMPTIVVVGRGFADGSVEVRDRRSGDRREVPVDDALPEVLAQAHGRPSVVVPDQG
ncbi:MAG: His/Gly/Thr/Pro-type tRNA ligase C-terminal domain-containing protein, partial [Janthinobacterium lividum]